MVFQFLVTRQVFLEVEHKIFYFSVSGLLWACKTHEYIYKTNSRCKLCVRVVNLLDLYVVVIYLKLVMRYSVLSPCRTV